MSLDQIPFCDIFHPTFDEFNNFENYIEKITKIAKSGIIKVTYIFLITDNPSKRLEG